MKIIKQSYEILTPISEGGIKELQFIERAARTCYKSEDCITEDGASAKRLIRSLIKSGHEAMLEHSMLSVRFITDRGISHELVRHRLFSFAQESQRYCNYGKDKFGREITFIEPYIPDEHWEDSFRCAEEAYFYFLDKGCSPQAARAVLPNAVKTEIVVTGNYREWRHFFKLRADKAAHPQMQELAGRLLNEVSERIPIVFDDVKEKAT